MIWDDIAYVVGAVILLYAIVTFLLSRVFIPLLGFTETRIPKKLPRGMREAIEDIEKKSKNKNDYARNVWKFVTSRWHGKRREYIKMPSILWLSLKHAWKKTGFLPCTMISYITRILLVRSRFFSKEDVKTMTYFHSFALHQCLRIKIDGHWVYMDPWAEHLGHGIGKRLPYF